MTTGLRLEWVLGKAVERFPLDEGTVLTFGRDQSCSVVLEPRDGGKNRKVKDLAISRHAGTIAVAAGRVILTNASTSRAIDIRESSGLPSVLPVCGNRVLTDLPVTLVITGAIQRHALRISTGGSQPPPSHPEASDSDVGNSDASMTQKVPLPTAGQRRVLAAMFEGYLVDFPRWDPNPTTYQAAGARLGLTEVAARRRIEEYRDKLKAAGIAGLEVRDARAALAHFLLSVGIITVADLDDL